MPLPVKSDEPTGVPTPGDLLELRKDGCFALGAEGKKRVPNEQANGRLPLENRRKDSGCASMSLV